MKSIHIVCDPPLIVVYFYNMEQELFNNPEFRVL
jgi:hypothetical protein